LLPPTAKIAWIPQIKKERKKERKKGRKKGEKNEATW
jgi:hypothetical protein